MLPLFLTLAKIQVAQTPAQAQTPTQAPMQLPVPPDPDRVVAKINGQEIHAREVEGYLWDWRGSEVTGDLITYRLIQGEAQKLGVKVAPEEIAKAFDAQMETMKTNVPPGQDVDAAMRQQGFPKSRLYLRVHTDLLLSQIVLKEFNPDGYVKVSTVAYRPKSEAAADLTTAIGRAQAAYERLQKGGEWTKEVTASDDDVPLKQHAGMLGWRLLSAFPANTQAELKAGAVGALSKPTQAAAAIQVFRVEGHGQAAKGTELEELRQSYLVTGRQQVIERLRKEAKIERLFPTEPPK